MGSLEEARQLGHNYIGTEHLLLGLIREGEGVAARVLENLGIDLTKVRTQVIRMLGETAEVGSGAGSSKGNVKTATLDEFGTNLTKLASESKLDPVVGRHTEIDRVIQILGRRTKNNPVLIGEPGVGKTAIAEGLAQRIQQGDIPDILENKRVLTLDIGLLVAGTKYRGEFEERLKKIMEEIKSAGNVILVIDEVHTLIGAGAAEGAIDAANILKPALARGELQCIGATTLDEYRKHIEKDPALERRFQPVNVPEPSVDDTVDILRCLRARYERHHGLKIGDDALEAASRMGAQYIADRFLPDKAIDLIDEACARVRLRATRTPDSATGLKRELRDVMKEKETAIREQDFERAADILDREIEIRAQLNIILSTVKRVSSSKETPTYESIVCEDDIAHVVAAWTGIPVNKLSKTESEKLLVMEDTLHSRIIGQEQAVSAVSKAIRRARVGLRNPNRPIASFLFSGPTGVGKTELTKALALFFFGAEDSMVRLDMSEYMEKHTVAKLIESPPGYVGYNEGGQLTEAVRSKPYSVVLFDEVEKAHPDVFNLLLQILDDGRLSDSKGRVIDFTNTLIVMTTNLGSKIIERESGIKSKSDQGDRGFKITPDAVLGWEPTPEPITDPKLFERTAGLVNEELKNFFRPEFLNRIDEIIVFNHLTRIDIWQICALMIKQVKTRLKEKDINLVVDLAVQAFLTDEGYDPIYGARPLRRAIMKYLEDSLAEQCLSKTLYPGTKIIVSRKKVEGTLLTYTNELEVEVNFDDVDPNLLQEGNELVNQSSQLLTDSSSNQTSDVIDIDGEPNSTESKKPRRRLSRFFNKTKS